MKPNQRIADAIRKVTAAVQKALDGGCRSRVVDVYDLVEVPLAVADELDPEFSSPNTDSAKRNRKNLCGR